MHFHIVEWENCAYSGFGIGRPWLESFYGGSVIRAIFISYRRDDTEGEAGRLFDDLVRSFGEGSVLMDRLRFRWRNDNTRVTNPL
jgi:hypothetical protein